VTTSADTRNGLIAKDGYAHYNQSVARLYAPLDGFKDAMYRAGVMTDVPIVADGEIHRFKPEGEKRPNGWYVFFGDGGAFGNWRTGLKENWYRGDICQSDRRKIQAQVKAAQKTLREKRECKHRESARIAARRWQAAVPTTEHPYLEAKGVRSHDLRIEGRNLLVPVCHGRQIRSLQIIFPDGRKRFLSGGRICGCYFPIGTPGERIWLAEGYATAATVHELTGDAVVCAFNAGNLVKVAAHIRERFTDRQIYVAADNDEAGISAAMLAMNKHNLEGVKRPDEEKADWNDFFVLHGAQRALEALSR
jgi:putative DNA primase/helicase